MAGIGFGNWSITAAGKKNRPAGAYQPHHVSRHAAAQEAVHDPPLVGPPRALPRAGLRALRRPLPEAASVLELVGYSRAEAPVKFVERRVKGLLFDCRMCGQCILSSTGMSCPMNCPKRLRNGPCGGVRANGNCEVEPDMPCVWVQAWDGSRHMKGGDAILDAAEAGRPFAARDLRLAAGDGAGGGSAEGEGA